MKNITATIMSVAVAISIFLPQNAISQSPEKMSYQSVIRNATGDLVTETIIGIQISILQGSSTGEVEYVETHTPMTNINGLASIELGMGIVLTGTFADINWGNGPYFIQSETDPNGGTSYILSGVSELLSVPYALYASEAGNVTFTTNGNVTSNALGNYATDDFVFGSPSLNDDVDANFGSRMFFDKSKRAFRAGGSGQSAWDQINVGFGSIAMGESTIASGTHSTALGLTTTASGDVSIAAGYGSIASGESSLAAGWLSTASGESSIAIGNSSIASGEFSLAIGNGATAGGSNSIAIGESADASVQNATALGWSTTASGPTSLAMGWSTTASSTSSTAMGSFTTASGQNATAMGYLTTASGEYSTAMGRITNAPSYAEVAIGSYNTSYEHSSTDAWSALDRAFVIGNGTLQESSDAMVVLKNGNVGLGTSAPNEPLEIGGNGRAFFGDGQGGDRKGLLIHGTHTSGAARIETYNYGLIAGMDLVINTTANGGNVGIHTSSPTAKLSVNGSANKPGGGSWAVFSDRRLKKDIRSYEDGLNSVLAINPVVFKYNSLSKADTISEFIGVIAQELEEISPYMINSIVIDDIDYLEVDNSAMTYMLINAVKEQQEMIEALQAKNAELKTINYHKDERLDNLDEKLQANTKLLQELNGILKTETNK